jgi:hypothetical protein
MSPNLKLNNGQAPINIKGIENKQWGRKKKASIKGW